MSELLNNPIIFQLLENIFNDITPFTMQTLQILINLKTEGSYSKMDLTKLIEEFALIRQEKMATKNNLKVKKFNVELNVIQIRMFFFHLRCFAEYLNLIKDSANFDPSNIFYSLNGIISVTQKFVDFLKLIKKDSENVDNLVEKWIKKGSTFDFEENDDMGKYYPYTRFTSTSLKNMSTIFKQLEEDPNDVMDKLERKSEHISLSSWELEGISIVICLLAKQAHDVASAGINWPKESKLALFLSSEYFRTVVTKIIL